ncbi:MAG: hypothetical protein WA688_03520 [Thermoplasmata archaeon]
MAIAVVILAPLASAQLTNKTTGSTAGLVGASASIAHVTGATVAQNQSSLTLPSPGALNIFGMANSGRSTTTGFASGNVVSATDK